MGQLKLNDCQESKLLNGLVKVLKNDAVLARVVKHWDLWDGKTSAMNKNRLPLIGVYPSDAGEAQKIAHNLSESKFPVDIVVMVDGTDATDVLNLWAAVRYALRQENLKTLGQECVMVVHWVSKPAYSEGEIEGNSYLMAKATIQCDLLVRA